MLKSLPISLIQSVQAIIETDFLDSNLENKMKRKTFTDLREWIDSHAVGAVYEGAEEHAEFADHTKNPYHKVLTNHGWKHTNTEHTKNPYATNNPKADNTQHVYKHPDHGKSYVVIDQEHDPRVGHGGKTTKGHSFIHKHEQKNGIMSPTAGDSKTQLHKILSSEYGTPKGMNEAADTLMSKVHTELANHLQSNHGLNVNGVRRTEYGKIPHLKVHASDTNGTSGIGIHRGQKVYWSKNDRTGKFHVEKNH